jgi:S1-C subfamily serine protease
MDRDSGSRRAFLTAVAAATAGLAGCESMGTAADTNAVSGEPTGEPSTPLYAQETATASGDRTGSASYTAAYEAAVGSVASVRIYNGSGGRAQGSAFVYDDRHLVTNEHVVSGGSSVFVRFEGGDWQPVSVVGTDVYSDLAVLRVEDRPESAPPLPFVREDPPVGTRVVAIGNPFGLSGSVSSGIISGADRTQDAANGFSIPDTVQTDAPVNPGNSGGPLVDLDGRVVGVINAGGGDNIGFAISAALTGRVVPELIADGEYEHSYMGVRLRDVGPALAEANDLEQASGVYIDDVVAGGPSDGVLEGSTGDTFVEGIEAPTGGDVVRTLDDTPVPTRQDLSTFLALETSPGTTVDVTVIRDGSEETVPLELGRRPEPN